MDVINLITEYGIEARIAAVLGNKRALFEGLFDGTSDAVRFDAPAGFLEDVQRLVEPVIVPDGASDPNEDGDGVDGDVGNEEPAGGEEPAAAQEPAAAHEGAEGQRAPRPSAAAAPPRAAALLERLSITRTENGGLRIEAPPEAAEELSELLRSLGEMLSAARHP